jgi:hypothetical protein
MKLKREDCEFSREPGWNRIRHLPTDRCVACRDDEITDDELFLQLEKELLRLEELGLIDNHENISFIDIGEESIH